jgi:uncharacterized protein YfdQ (DUF2303 family)
MNSTDQNTANMAETIVREARKPFLLDTKSPDYIKHVAVPSGYSLQTIDDEAKQEYPRYKMGSANVSDVASFLAYIDAHRNENTRVWCLLDPLNSVLTFQAVLDDHGGVMPGWRAHRAVFAPAHSVEWGRWTAQAQAGLTEQLIFAHFIESNQEDIASGEGMPTSLQMLQMASEFEASADKRIRSHSRLQSGGVSLEYVDQDNAETIQKMRMFDSFSLGIPVFRGEAAYRVTAKLRYRINSGSVKFAIELLRQDKVAEAASRDLVAKVQEGLNPMGLTLTMGGFENCANLQK